MTRKKTKIHYPLYPLSILYGLGVRFRNLLFDYEILKSQPYPAAVICVGNLTVGGTGKTPHIEYLIRLLTPIYKVAILSRGYKRQSKGFVLGDINSTPQLLGDEPYQLKNKFPQIDVAVDADRRNGIQQLLQLPSPPQVILLDDAFQHRYVKPGLSLLLSDYNRPFYEDALLPAGRLREGKEGKKRADVIIVSKTPASLTNDAKQQIEKQIAPLPGQQVFFSSLHYEPLKPVFEHIATRPLNTASEILLVTGIARPEIVEKEIARTYRLNESIVFADHHDFTEADIQKISQKFKAISNKQKAIIVTEKDAVRLRHNPHINDYLKENMYFLPLEIVFLHNETNRFNQIILDYVAENQRHS
ncbi:MAG: tetraacyldisaccharide 4'-kinase [Bacteroidales bacterium]